MHHVHHALILHDVSFLPVSWHAQFSLRLGLGVLVDVVVSIGVVLWISNIWVVIVDFAVERVLWLGAATGSHVVDQTFKLCSLTSVFVRWSSGLAVLDDELGFPFALVQLAVLLEGSGLLE